MNRSTTFVERSFTQDVWGGYKRASRSGLTSSHRQAQSPSYVGPETSLSRQSPCKPRDLGSSTSRPGPDSDQVAGRARRDVLNIGLLDDRQRLLCHAARENMKRLLSAWEPQLNRDLPRVSSPGPQHSCVGQWAGLSRHERQSRHPRPRSYQPLSGETAFRVTQQAREVSGCPSIGQGGECCPAWRLRSMWRVLLRRERAEGGRIRPQRV